MFSKKIVELQNSDFNKKKEGLIYLAKKFVDKDLVTTDFPQQILSREEKYPTGLEYEDFGMAIPHADPEYVKTEQIAIMTLKEPILFQSMENANKKVNVNMIFMLALKNPEGHLEILQELMSLLQDKETVDLLLSLENTEDDIEKAINLFN